MTVQRRHKPFTFQDGSQIEVWQASWDMSMDRREIEDQARAEKAKQNGSGDPELFFFHEEIYAGLAACSSGEIPELQKAFHLHPQDLDGWWQTAREVNPGWYEPGELIEHAIKISDGSAITVLSKRPSVVIRRFHLDREAERGAPLDNSRKEIFRVIYYPKLAGCSTGDVPSMEEARTQWGEEDLQAWYDAAKQVVPEWFLSLEELALQNQQRTETITKKKSRRRAK